MFQQNFTHPVTNDSFFLLQVKDICLPEKTICAKVEDTRKNTVMQGKAAIWSHLTSCFGEACENAQVVYS